MRHKMEMENLSCMEEKELIVVPSSEVFDDEEYITIGEEIFNKCNNKNSNKRRLVITTMSAEPILIEIRPSLQEPLMRSSISKSTQCNIIEKECHCNENSCLEHMNLWNELYEVIHDSNTHKFIEESCFEKEVKDSFVDRAKGINCRELWPQLCKEALQSIRNLKKDLQKERDGSETQEKASTKFNDLEVEMEKEKTMEDEECHAHSDLITKLRNQVSKQAEEIRRLYTENLTIEDDSVNLKLDESKSQEDIIETKQRILDLELQLVEESKLHKITLTNQEEKCEFLQSKIDELETKQAAILLEKNELDNLKLKIEELEKENLQYQKEVILSTFRNDDDDDKILDYATLQKEYEMVKEELEKVSSDYNRTSNKLRHNVAKRRRLEAESEGEKQQRSNLVAALYEMEKEVEATILIVNSLQSTTFESISALAMDLQIFQEALEKHLEFDDSKITSISQDDIDNGKTTDTINEQNHIQSFDGINSNTDIYKGIPGTESIVSKMIQENEKILKEIFTMRISIGQIIKNKKCEVFESKKEMITKLESIEVEKETLRRKTKVLDEENKSLEEENAKLQDEICTLKSIKTKLALELKDEEKEIEDLQENLKTLREENRRLLKEAKWKSVGKQGGYQESLIVQEWEKKLKKLETDYEILRRSKKELVKDKHRLENELDRAVEKGYKGLGGSEDQRKLEDELFHMTQERNKLRKIKITLAIENVSLKESNAELKTKIDVFQKECKSLQEWKAKVQKLEEDCEDLRDWKNKAEALEVECRDLRDNQMKVEAHEIECKIKKNSKIEELAEESKKINESIQATEDDYMNTHNNEISLEEECKKLYECKLHLEEECQKLHEHIDHLDKECNDLREYKEKIENSNRNSELLNANKLYNNVLESENLNDDESKMEVDVRNKILHEQNSMDAKDCAIQEYLEQIENLKHENMKLCENHQATLDKQWNVLQVDLKSFEAKVEELESECESIRRDHLSSMVDNAELAREKDRLLTLYNEQKYNYEILETANECLQKDQEQKEARRIQEKNDYHASINNLNKKVLELESIFCERLHQLSTNYTSCLAIKAKINGRDTITLTHQEYEILLAEKAVMLQERDSAHKKLCSVEIQNFQLNASIECLQQEISSKNEIYEENQTEAEVLLAQDVINLRSMVSSLEEELGSANCEKNKLFDQITSLKGEINEIHEAFSHCQHENNNLNGIIEELNRRSSLEQIHSAASSLKEQLGKASKEKDLIKEQLSKVVKEKEQLANVANERDNVILSLKEDITKLKKEKEESCSSFKIQLQKMEDNIEESLKIKEQFTEIVKERDEIKEELVANKKMLESLHTTISHIESDHTKKVMLWQKEQNDFEEKCKRMDMELQNTKDEMVMTKKKMQNDIEELINERNNFKLITQKEIKDANEKYTNLAKVKEELLETNLSLVNEQDHLLTIIENLKTEKETITKKSQEDLISIKALLATTIKEKEELVTNEEYLQKTLDGLYITMKSLNEQVTFLSSEKDKIFEAKEIITIESNALSHKISNFDNYKETRLNNDNFQSKEQTNGGLIICGNVIKSHVQNDNIESILVQEKELMTNEHNKHLEDSSLLKKDNDIKHGRKGKRRWNSKGFKEEIASLLIEKEQFFASEALLKQQLVDLEKEYTSKSSSLIHEKTTLLKEHENLIEEIDLLKKEKIEIEKKLENGLVQKTTSLANLQNAHTTIEHDLLAKQEEYDKLMKDYMQLKEENIMLVQIKDKFAEEHENLVKETTLLKKENEDLNQRLKDEMIQLPLLKTKLYETLSQKDELVTLELNSKQQLNTLKEKMDDKEHLQIKLEGEISELQQTIRTLNVENDKLLKECGQHSYELSSLLKKKETLLEECDNFSKQITMLKSEKELLAKKYAQIEFEKEHILASQLSLQTEVETLNKTLLSLNEQIVELIEKNKKLEIEVSSTRILKKLNDQEQQTCEPTLFNTNEVGVFFSVEQCMNHLNIEFGEKNKQLDMASSPITKIHSEIEIESLNDQLEYLKKQQNEIIKERDALKSSLKEIEQTFNNIVIYKMEIETLKQKLDLLNKQQNQLSQERDNVLQENKSLSIQCNDLQAKLSTLKDEGNIVNSSIESKVRKNEVFKEKFQKHEIVDLEILVKMLKEQQTNLTKENMEIAIENEVLIKEKDSLLASISSLKKQYEANFLQELNKNGTLEASLTKKFEELIQIVNALNRSQKYHASQNEVLKEAIHSCPEDLNSLDSIQLSTEKQHCLCSNIDNNLNEKINHYNVVKIENLIGLQESLRKRLDDLAKTTSSLTKSFIGSIKENEKLVSEITFSKQECQKLRIALANSEKEKENLIKKVMESRSTIDRFTKEINQLQRKLVDVEMKLGHTTSEKDNAELQIAELQMLLSNQQRMQHLPTPYSMEKVQTLEAQNRCLKMEKDVLEECLNKRSVEFDGNHRFQQHLPSMTNFNPQLPSYPLLHSSSQLYHSRLDPLGRPQPSLHSMLHQQWPM